MKVKRFNESSSFSNEELEIIKNVTNEFQALIDISNSHKIHYGYTDHIGFMRPITSERYKYLNSVRLIVKFKSEVYNGGFVKVGDEINLLNHLRENVEHDGFKLYAGIKDTEGYRSFDILVVTK